MYGISDANPQSIHLTVPKSARLRRAKPKSVIVHYDDLADEDITVHEGLSLTTIRKTIAYLLVSGDRIDLLRQAVSDARREGYISNAEAGQLRRKIGGALEGVARIEQQTGAENRMTKPKTPERLDLDKRLARVAREQGVDQERLRRWVSFLSLCGALDSATQAGTLAGYYTISRAVSRWNCVSPSVSVRQRIWIWAWKVLARPGCSPYRKP